MCLRGAGAVSFLGGDCCGQWGSLWPRAPCVTTLCGPSRCPQERVSSIHPEDLMQIISHMDSRDNHRVSDRRCHLTEPGTCTCWVLAPGGVVDSG